MDDFEVACKGLFRALNIREKYMKLAIQRFPHTVSEHLRTVEGEKYNPKDQLQPGNKSNSFITWAATRMGILWNYVNTPCQGASSIIAPYHLLSYTYRCNLK